MAVVTLGLFSNTIQGIEGAILLALVSRICISSFIYLCRWYHLWKELVQELLTILEV